MKIDFCKKQKSNAEYQVISLEQLFDKIRDNKVIYEDVNNRSVILLVEGNSSNPLVSSFETNKVEKAIEIIQSRLECKLGQKSPALIKFEYIEKQYLFRLFSRYAKKTLWTVLVNTEKICSQEE